MASSDVKSAANGSRSASAEAVAGTYAHAASIAAAAAVTGTISPWGLVSCRQPVFLNLRPGDLSAIVNDSRGVSSELSQHPRPILAFSKRDQRSVFGLPCQVGQVSPPRAPYQGVAL